MTEILISIDPIQRTPMTPDQVRSLWQSVRSKRSGVRSANQRSRHFAGRSFKPAKNDGVIVHVVDRHGKVREGRAIAETGITSQAASDANWWSVETTVEPTGLRIQLKGGSEGGTITFSIDGASRVGSYQLLAPLTDQQQLDVRALTVAEGGGTASLTDAQLGKLARRVLGDHGIANALRAAIAVPAA